MHIKKFNEINKKTIVIENGDKLLMTSTYNFKNEREKNDFLYMYQCVKNTEKKEKAVFKTFDTDKYYIDDYVKNWRGKILTNCSMFNLNNMFLINSFVVNGYVLNHITEEELNEITKSLLNVFPLDNSNNKDFNRITHGAQFKSNTDNFFISDYAITEYKKYIIIWHLDLNNGLNTNISSIFKKKDFELLKPLTKKLKVA